MPGLLPGDERHRAFYRSAFATEGACYRSAFATEGAFKTGVAVSADLWLGGFDIHSHHDSDHEWLFGNPTGIEAR